jgi:hypothetical protein
MKQQTVSIFDLNPNTAQTVYRVISEMMAARRKRFRTERSTPIQLGLNKSPLVINPPQKDTENNIDDRQNVLDFKTKKVSRSETVTEGHKEAYSLYNRLHNDN